MLEVVEDRSDPDRRVVSQAMGRRRRIARRAVESPETVRRTDISIRNYNRAGHRT
ncbi:hypothetical protein [Natrinema caseinilyticum]|uniref:hypothetical protein n=1 Tax=Natrinema caseinilyticum TaxID=2961570 RepID=UPI0020C3CDFA|nr:hypothetical protein [Natrinema caseinilyticum]